MSTRKDRDLRQLVKGVAAMPVSCFAYLHRRPLVPEAQHQLTQRIYRAGVRMFLTGTAAGEHCELSGDELVELVRITRKATGPDAVIFGALSPPTAAACEVATRYADSGADGICYLPPPPGQCYDAAGGFYETVARECKLPGLIWMRGVPTDIEPLIRMVREQISCGLIIESADTAGSAGLADDLEHQIPLLCASDPLTYAALAGRFAGFVSTAANLVPGAAAHFYNAMTAGDQNAARRYSDTLLEVDRAVSRWGTVGSIKKALELLLRIAGGNTRYSTTPFDSGDCSQLEHALRTAVESDRALVASE